VQKDGPTSWTKPLSVLVELLIRFHNGRRLCLPPWVTCGYIKA